MKKIVLFLLTIAVSVLLCSCSLGEPQIKLTEEESDAIAQYCAHLIMKYGAKELYGEKLLDKRDYEDAVKEREAEKNPSPTPTQAPTPTPEAEPGPEGGDTEKTDDDSKHVVTPEASKSDNASALFDPSIFEVTVSGNVFTKNYKSDLEYFTLSAPAGKFVAAFTIDVKNISSQNKVFDYNNYNVQFQLVVDGTKSISPEISLLSNDFRFTRSEIVPDSVFSPFNAQRSYNFVMSGLRQDLELTNNSLKYADTQKEKRELQDSILSIRKQITELDHNYATILKEAKKNRIGIQFRYKSGGKENSYTFVFNNDGLTVGHVLSIFGDIVELK